ncbi:MAG TPA: hypothetical protein VG326_03625 [Tepidisphaeraceae bacterium]|jgi:hypothetical protein|nr:hypothetical protein [Tepidisphaeraceae bacterium]
MSHYVLSFDRSQRISGAARTLWSLFLDERPQYRATSLLERVTPLESSDRGAKFSSFIRNECAVAFCSYCAISLYDLSCEVVNHVSLERWVASVSGRPSSWLHGLDGFPIGRDDPSLALHEVPPRAEALIDQNYVLAESAQNAERVWTCLLLHEVGHLVLHWPDFKRQNSSDGKAMATDEQEAEAWLFQSTILGLALGSYAHSRVIMPRRTDGDVHEDAWKFLW